MQNPGSSVPSTATGAGGGAGAASAKPCQFTPTPADPVCDFKAKLGAVTLTLKNITGTVVFQKATYNGVAITTPAAQITFSVVAGQKNLDVVYGFSDAANGKAELHESCGANTFLGNVDAGNPATRYVICG